MTSHLHKHGIPTACANATSEDTSQHDADCMCRYLADLVISYLQDVLAAAILGVGHTSHATGGHAAALPPPMFLGNDGVPDALCINPGHDFKVLVTSHEVRTPSPRKPCTMMHASGLLNCSSAAKSLLGIAMLGACLTPAVVMEDMSSQRCKQ